MAAKSKPKTAKKFSFQLSNLSIALVVILGIILIFTGIDYFIHSLSEEYAVPDYYFTNKIIYGTLYGFVAWLFIKNKNPLPKSLIFSAIISILLQIRYLMIGYPIKFVLEFLIIHFLILLPLSYLAFRLAKRIV